MIKRITIYDVAAEAGVSHTTVNQALRNAVCVKAETKKRILEVAARLGYRRNNLASSLRTGESKRVALITTRLDGTFGQENLPATLQTQLSRMGYDLVLYPILTEKNGQAIFEHVLLNGYDAVITYLFSYSQLAPFAEVFAQRHCPVLVIGTPPDMAFPKGVIGFSFDNLECLRDLLDQLYELGHRHIVHAIPSRLTKTPQNLLFQAFRKEKGIVETNPAETFTESGRNAMENGYLYALKILEKYPETTAIQCPNDNFALGMVRAFQDKGISVPQDISIIGSNYSAICSYSVPRLASIEIGVENAVPEMVKCLMEHLHAQEWDGLPQEFRLKAVLHTGESIAKVRKAPLLKGKK